MRESRTAFARALRKRQTHAEAVLWQYLRAGRLDGLRFRRQHPIDRYFVDFACVALRLVVELDGGVHEADERRVEDWHRQAAIEGLGWSVVRFRNEQVVGDLPSVLAGIRDHVRLAGGGGPLPPIAGGDGPLPLPEGEGFRKRRLPKTRIPHYRP